jgi:tetratricopeptide (TPR) repeat protein
VKTLGLEKQQVMQATLNNIGYLYSSQGKYAEALEYYFKAKKSVKTLDLEKQQAMQ